MGADQVGSTRLWKVGVRRAMVYSEGKELTERILAVAKPPTNIENLSTRPANNSAERLLPGTMAVYCDRKGKPFAWQIAFDAREWDQVSEMVGLENS